MRESEAEAQNKIKVSEVEAVKKFQALEAETKILYLDHEKSLKEAADKLLQQEKQLQDAEAEKKSLLIEYEKLQ
jgi:hypothetical protein